MSLKTSLQLGKIILKNYRTYKDTVKIELSRDPEKTITIIEGEMGKGKTTLLNSIYWCLYGKFRPGGNRSDENIINNDVLSSLQINDEDDTFVEIYLYEEDDLRYKIKRNIHFVKNQESSQRAFRSDLNGSLPDGIEIISTVEFSHLPKTSANQEWVVYTDPTHAHDAVLNIFPEQLYSYFLFDAELLDDFFDQNSTNNVRGGIEDISGLPVVVDAIKHIKKTYGDLLKDIDSPKTEPIKQDIFFYEKSIENSKKIITKEKQKLQEIDAEIGSIESYLRNNDERSVQEKQERSDELKKANSEIREKLTKHEKEMNDWLLYCNAISRLHDSMVNSMNMCNEWEKQGKIPIAVSGQALKNILDANPSICICGRHLVEGSKERTYMEELQTKNTADSPIIQSITTGRGHWDEMVEDSTHSSLTKKLKENRSARDQLHIKLDENNVKLKAITDELKKHDQEQIREKSRRLGDLKIMWADSTGIEAIEVDKIRKAKLQLEEKNRDLDKWTRVEGKYQSHHNRRNMAKTIEKILKQCKDDLIEQLRSTVAKKTTEYFLRLVSRDDFSYVEIKPDYVVTAHSPSGHSKDLSAGQTCCLALSYIAAIREIAEKNYFMMIDSPLHNIDQNERVDIAKNLPNFIPGTQITLLVQNQEYVGRINKTENREEIPSVRETLKKNNTLWREYKLKFNETPETKSYNTTVEEMT